MLILAIKPGHDGAVAAIDDGELLFSIEGEKDSLTRHAALTESTLLTAAQHLPGTPDIVALGGWRAGGATGFRAIGAGYHGADQRVREAVRFFGRHVDFFSSSHERSHVMMAVGMAPDEPRELQTVLVWEGAIGVFYVVDRHAAIVQRVPVLRAPGTRYALLYAIADPTFPDVGLHPSDDCCGKLMALASFADERDADDEILETVDQLLEITSLAMLPKGSFKKSPIYNAGPEAPVTKIAAAVLTRRLFERFAEAAHRCTPKGSPLRISGGCGLNCTWNQMWREDGHFSSVFVPPCTNDSGSAIGTAIDAYHAATGHHRIAWSVYSGLEFDHDVDPPTERWAPRPLDCAALAQSLLAGDIAAWVQGRWEIGPRALGNRSLIAEPFNAATRDRLNTIKQREAYRPIAPCCRVEDTARVFSHAFEDPYMLYTRKVTADGLEAVTHVDGTARLQTVTPATNPALYRLLSAMAGRTGMGVLCNTSLNFKERGFINRMSDLIEFVEARGVDHMVVGDCWYARSGPMD